MLGEGAVLRRGLQGLFRCEEQNLPRPLVRASSGCRGDTHEVAGVLSEEVVLRRGLQGLPAGAGWYVPEGSGAGPWEDRSASYTGSSWTVSSELGERVEAWLEQAAEAGAMEEVEGWRAAAQVAALEQQVEELQGQVAGLEGEQARVEYLQVRVAEAEAMVASAEEAVHTLREDLLQSLRRETQLHDQVLELELHALALQEQVEQVQAAAATEVAAAEAAGQATTAGELEDAEFFEVFFAEAVGWLLDRVDGGQLEAEEQARWEDIRRELAEWHEGPSEEEDEEEEEEEERLPGIPEAEAEPEEEVRCSSVTCPSLRLSRGATMVHNATDYDGLKSCGCPFVVKEVAGVMHVCAVEDENEKEE